MIKAVLFDLDGTLLDTSEGIMDSVKYAIHELGLSELPKETILKFVGPPIQNSLITYCGLSKEEAQKGANIFRDYYKSQALFKATPYSGIIDLLQSIKDKDIKIGVATYKREDYAIDLLKHFGIAYYCDIIHGADNENKLTKADIIDLCISELGESKGNVVLVGDTDHDAKGAQDAGVAFIAVTWGFGYNKQSTCSKYPYIDMIETPQDFSFLLRHPSFCASE